MRALAEMQIVPKTFRERQKMKEVQQVAIKMHRKEDPKGVKNPLEDKKGGWLLEEFVAMAATYKE